MWMVFPFYLNKTKTIEEAFIHGIIAISLALLVYRILFHLNGILYNISLDQWEPWLWYIWRGVYCYALGCFLYHMIGKKKFSNLESVLSTIFLLMVLVLRLLELGNNFSGFLFALIWTLILLLNYNSSLSLVSNSVFSFFGRYSMEVFTAHLLVGYFFALWTGAISQGWKCFFVTWFLTIGLALPLHFISERIGALLVRLEERMNHYKFKSNKT